MAEQLLGRSKAAGVSEFDWGKWCSYKRSATISLRDAPQPIDDYAISKWEAEEALKAVAANTSLEVEVRPLVYGQVARAICYAC